MKTFNEFIVEVYDPEVQGRSQIRKQGEGGRVFFLRKKSEPEKRRMKALVAVRWFRLRLIRIEKILVVNVREQRGNNNPLKQEVVQD